MEFDVTHYLIIIIHELGEIVTIIFSTFNHKWSYRVMTVYKLNNGLCDLLRRG